MKWARIGVGLAVLAMATMGVAQDGKRVSSACRREIIKTCGMAIDRSKMREYMMAKASTLPEG